MSPFAGILLAAASALQTPAFVLRHALPSGVARARALEMDAPKTRGARGRFQPAVLGGGRDFSAALSRGVERCSSGRGRGSSGGGGGGGTLHLARAAAAAGNASAALASAKVALRQPPTTAAAKVGLVREVNQLLRLLGDRGALAEAGEVFRAMLDARLTPTQVTYGTLIARAGTWRQPRLATAYYKDMQRRGIEPDTLTHNSLINAFAKVLPRHCLDTSESSRTTRSSMRSQRCAASRGGRRFPGTS